MDDTQLYGLKQFFASTIAQSQAQQLEDLKRFTVITIRQSADRQLDDLKQFVLATVSQQLGEFRLELDRKLGKFRDEMRDGFAGLGVIIEDHNNRLDGHEVRIVKLERKAA